MGILCPGKESGAGGGVGGSQTMESRFSGLVGPLSLIVCLWMEAGGQANSYSLCGAERPPHCRRELWATVRHHVEGKAVPAEYSGSNNLIPC